MPFEHTISSWDESVFKYAEQRKKAVGFDGMFSIPNDNRVMLELTQLGERVMLMKVFGHLGLSGKEAKSFMFEMMKQKHPSSVEEVDKFFAELTFK